MQDSIVSSCLSSLSADVRICSPPFMVLNSECGPDTLEQIKQHGLTFPFSKFPPFLSETENNKV